MVDTLQIATNAETPISAKSSVAVKHRQPRKFDRKALATVIDRPGNRNAAPGLLRGDRARDLIFRIELQLGGDLAPQPSKCRGSARTHKLDELVRADREADIVVHLPDKAQRMTSLGFVITTPGRSPRHRRVGNRWRRKRTSRRGFFGSRFGGSNLVWLHAEFCHQNRRRIAAKAVDGHWTEGRRSTGAAG